MIQGMLPQQKQKTVIHIINSVSLISWVLVTAALVRFFKCINHKSTSIRSMMLKQNLYQNYENGFLVFLLLFIANICMFGYFNGKIKIHPQEKWFYFMEVMTLTLISNIFISMMFLNHCATGSLSEILLNINYIVSLIAIFYFLFFVLSGLNYESIIFSVFIFIMFFVFFAFFWDKAKIFPVKTTTVLDNTI